MEIKLLEKNVAGNDTSLNSALLFAGKMAGTCYLQDSMDTVLQENNEATMSRVNTLLNRRHHSPFEHVTYTFLLEEMPKILAIILNNEKVYSTSEKSARFTQLDLYGPEAELYNKWQNIFQKQIEKKYPFLTGNKLLSLARENARYIISIFSPTTVMVYTTNLRQLNYVLDYIEEYIVFCKTTDFNKLLIPILKEFCDKMEPFKVPQLVEEKNVILSLFAERSRENEFGEVYSVSYNGSFAQLAQAQRHRTINYEIMLPRKTELQFYIPQIIASNSELKKEWIKDMQSMAPQYPQGLMVEINERGTLENFIRKCHERLCGSAQLEIMEQTRQTLARYYSRTKLTKPKIAQYILPYLNHPRCKFGWRCPSPCIWGPDGAFSRKV